MILRKRVFLYFGVILLLGCKSQPMVKQESAYILLKTPTFKYSDMGFIYENSEEVKVEIYGVGQALMRLSISKERVCLSLLQCMSKQRFNQEVLSSYYPANLIEQIFRAKPIFEQENIEKNSNGFTQIIKRHNKVNISYKVFKKEIDFHDKINNIHIKVKK